MSALVLDAGVLAAIDRGDQRTAARLATTVASGFELRSSPLVVAEVWGDDRGRQVHLGRLLRSVEIEPVTEAPGRQVGVLCGAAGTDDPVDALVALLAQPGDLVLTADPDDIRALLSAAGVEASVVEV